MGQRKKRVEEVHQDKTSTTTTNTSGTDAYITAFTKFRDIAKWKRTPYWIQKTSLSKPRFIVPPPPESSPSTAPKPVPPVSSSDVKKMVTISDILSAQPTRDLYKPFGIRVAEVVAMKHHVTIPDVLRRTCTPISRAVLSNQSSAQTRNALNDPTLAPRSRRQKCRTCYDDMRWCPLHGGYVELAVPVLLLHRKPKVIRFLRQICFWCARPLIDKKSPRFASLAMKKPSHRLAECDKITQRICQCGRIPGYRSSKIKRKKKKSSSSEEDDKKRVKQRVQKRRDYKRELQAEQKRQKEERRLARELERQREEYDEEFGGDDNDEYKVDDDDNVDDIVEDMDGKDDRSDADDYVEDNEDKDHNKDKIRRRKRQSSTSSYTKKRRHDDEDDDDGDNPISHDEYDDDEHESNVKGKRKKKHIPSQANKKRRDDKVEDDFIKRPRKKLNRRGRHEDWDASDDDNFENDDNDSGDDDHVNTESSTSDTDRKSSDEDKEDENDTIVSDNAEGDNDNDQEVNNISNSDTDDHGSNSNTSNHDSDDNDDNDDNYQSQDDDEEYSDDEDNTSDTKTRIEDLLDREKKESNNTSEKRMEANIESFMTYCLDPTKDAAIFSEFRKETDEFPKPCGGLQPKYKADRLGIRAIDPYDPKQSWILDPVRIYQLLKGIPDEFCEFLGVGRPEHLFATALWIPPADANEQYEGDNVWSHNHVTKERKAMIRLNNKLLQLQANPPPNVSTVRKMELRGTTLKMQNEYIQLLQRHIVKSKDTGQGDKDNVDNNNNNYHTDRVDVDEKVMSKEEHKRTSSLSSSKDSSMNGKNDEGISLDVKSLSASEKQKLIYSLSTEISQITTASLAPRDRKHKGPALSYVPYEVDTVMDKLHRLSIGNESDNQNHGAGDGDVKRKMDPNHIVGLTDLNNTILGFGSNIPDESLLPSVQAPSKLSKHNWWEKVQQTRSELGYAINNIIRRDNNPSIRSGSNIAAATTSDMTMNMRRLQNASASIKSQTAKLQGKEGFMRMYVDGKRVNFSFRAVVIVAPELPNNLIEIPSWVAMEHAIQEFVQEHTIHVLTIAVRNGPNVWPGAKSIIDIDGTRYDLQFLQHRNIVLRHGMIVERHMTSADINKVTGAPRRTDRAGGGRVIANRQPTLHKASIQGHNVVIRDMGAPGEYRLAVIRMNYQSFVNYHADCDGDEINVHPATEKGSQIEMDEMMESMYNVTYEKDGQIAIAPVQDDVIAAWLWTSSSTVFRYQDALQHLYSQGLPFKRMMVRELPPPSYWVKEIFSSEKSNSPVVHPDIPIYNDDTNDGSHENDHMVENSDIEDAEDTEDAKDTEDARDESSSTHLRSSIADRPRRHYSDLAGTKPKQRVIIGCMRAYMTGMDLFSAILPQQLCAFEDKPTIPSIRPQVHETGFYIDRGRLLYGRMNSDRLHMIIKACVTDLGLDSAGRFLFSISRCAHSILWDLGLSYGINECENPNQRLTTKIMYNALKWANSKHPDVQNLPEEAFNDILEKETNDRIEQVISSAVMDRVVLERERHGALEQWLAGSRGSGVHMRKTIVCMGATYSRGQRFKECASSLIGLGDAESKGYMTCGLMGGLTFKQITFHTEAARDGVAQMATSISEGGYCNRRMASGARPAQISSAGTVVSLDGERFDDLYGGDGFLPTAVVMTKCRFIMMGSKELEQNYSMISSAKTPIDMAAAMWEFQQIQRGQWTMRQERISSMALEDKFTNSVPSPVCFERLVADMNTRRSELLSWYRDSSGKISQSIRLQTDVHLERAFQSYLIARGGIDGKQDSHKSTDVHCRVNDVDIMDDNPDEHLSENNTKTVKRKDKRSDDDDHLCSSGPSWTPKGKTSDFMNEVPSIEEVVSVIKCFCESFQKRYHINPNNNRFCILLYDWINSRNVIQVYKWPRAVFYESLNRIENMYISAVAPEGANVGMKAIQSAAQPLVQIAFDSFHSAGAKNQTLNQGFPRFKEIIDMTKAATPTSRLPLKTIHDESVVRCKNDPILKHFQLPDELMRAINTKEFAENLASRLPFVTFGKLVKRTQVLYDPYLESTNIESDITMVKSMARLFSLDDIHPRGFMSPLILRFELDRVQLRQCLKSTTDIVHEMQKTLSRIAGSERDGLKHHWCYTTVFDKEDVIRLRIDATSQTWKEHLQWYIKKSNGLSPHALSALNSTTFINSGYHGSIRSEKLTSNKADDDSNKKKKKRHSRSDSDITASSSSDSDDKDNHHRDSKNRNNKDDDDDDSDNDKAKDGSDSDNDNILMDHREYERSALIYLGVRLREETVISGIRNIHAARANKTDHYILNRTTNAIEKEQRWYVDTIGSNIRGILDQYEWMISVELLRLSNIAEMNSSFSLMATSDTIVEGLRNIIPRIDVRHHRTIARIMTHFSKPRGYNRFGVTHCINPSPLSRCLFETPVRIIIAAGENGEVGNMNSDAENGMVGQLQEMGSMQIGIIPGPKHPKDRILLRPLDPLVRSKIRWENRSKLAERLREYITLCENVENLDSEIAQATGRDHINSLWVRRKTEQARADLLLYAPEEYYYMKHKGENNNIPQSVDVSSVTEDLHNLEIGKESHALMARPPSESVGLTPLPPLPTAVIAVAFEQGLLDKKKHSMGALLTSPSYQLHIPKSLENVTSIVARKPTFAAGPAVAPVPPPIVDVKTQISFSVDGGDTKGTHNTWNDPKQRLKIINRIHIWQQQLYPNLLDDAFFLNLNRGDILPIRSTPLWSFPTGLDMDTQTSLHHSNSLWQKRTINTIDKTSRIETGTTTKEQGEANTINVFSQMQFIDLTTNDSAGTPSESGPSLSIIMRQNVSHIQKCKQFEQFLESCQVVDAVCNV